jgi:hypothetical protein
MLVECGGAFQALAYNAKIKASAFSAGAFLLFIVRWE